MRKMERSLTHIPYWSLTLSPLDWKMGIVCSVTLDREGNWTHIAQVVRILSFHGIT